MHGFEEIKRPRFLACGIGELDAVLPHKRALLQLLEHTHATKGPVSVSHQRFADVMTGKYCLLEQDYTATLAGQHAGDGTPCGHTTHYYDVVSIINHA